MFEHDYPRTVAAAKAHAYGEWAGNPEGKPYIPGQCAVDEVPPGKYRSRQCQKPAGHGEGGLLCVGHARRQKNWRGRQETP
jgi:hypothetical protein